MPRRWLCIFLMTVLGCQAQPPGTALPSYSNLDSDSAQAILAGSAKMVHTMTGPCELTLKSHDGQTIRLDGLMVMAPPDRVRLRVWKMDQAVFDLTALPSGVWIEAAPQSSAGGGGPIVPATVSAGRLSRELALLVGGFFTSPGLRQEPSAGGELLYSRNEDDGTSIVCEVDPATATARRFTLRDTTGKTRFTLEMSDYREVDGIVWPIRLAATDTGDSSEIDVVFSGVQFNAQLAPRAFIPPAGAEKQP
jgi:hypothetical protein